MTARLVLMSVVLLASLGEAAAQPLGTAFTYQGRLVDAGSPANGTYDLQLVLFDAAVGGSQIGPIVLRNDVAVTNGLFTVTLDFGAVFGGSKRFLEVGVRPGASSGAYTLLSPRQELTPSPNALFSANAATIGGLSCANGQVAKWNGGWTCGTDIDTDTNSGGDITDVIAGSGLVGGGGSGAVTLDIVGLSGIAVAANAISLDTAFTDARYVNVTGDTMAGSLDMSQQRVLNRGCPGGYVRVGPGLCVENVDAVGFTFTGCANRCRAAGTHMCSSTEMRAVMASGVSLGSSTLLDWIDDQVGDDSALYVNNGGDAENPDGARATSTSSWCRCCANVE